MAQQIICNTCGEVIDQASSYWTGSIQSVQMIDGVLQSGSGSVQLDYHSDHLPNAMAGAESGD